MEHLTAPSHEVETLCVSPNVLMQCLFHRTEADRGRAGALTLSLFPGTADVMLLGDWC